MAAFVTAEPIDTRPVGSQGLRAGAQGLGCMGMTAFYGIDDPSKFEAQSLDTIARALELGVTMLDTAYVYIHSSGATNEALVGKAIKAHGRDKFIIATKFGYRITKEGMKVDSTPEGIRACLADSLSRLDTDYIDLYYQHRVDPNTPIEVTMGCLKELVAEGKIKYVGLSECSADILRRAHAVFPVTAIQMEWSLWTRSIEASVVPTARELGVAIVAYSPVGRGMLSGNFNKPEDLKPGDWRANNPRFQGENFEKNREMVRRLEAIAARKGCTTSQLALAWVHTRGADVFPIPGTKQVKYIEQNAAAFHLSKTLTADDIAEIEACIPPEDVAGDRYEASFMSRLHENQ